MRWRLNRALMKQGLRQFLVVIIIPAGLVAVTWLPVLFGPYPIEEYPEYLRPIPVGSEIVVEKPNSFFGLRDSVPAIQRGLTVGEIYENAAVHCLTPEDGQPTRRVILFAWLWMESASVLGDKTLVLVKSDNLRIASNRQIIGRLNEGATGTLLHMSSKKSWGLVKLELDLESSAIVAEKTWGIIHGPTEKTVTTQDGGEYRDEIVPEIYFLLNLQLFLRHYWRQLSAIGFFALLVWVFVRYGKSSVQRPFWLGKVDSANAKESASEVNKRCSENDENAVKEEPLEKKP
jgi:hypothetical protein